MDNPDFDFSMEFLQWCNDNGVANREQVKILFGIVNRYYIPKTAYFPSKPIRQASYPDYRALRKKKGVKMELVAALVGISKVQLHYIETRKVIKPNFDTLSKLNLYYEISESPL